MKNKILGTCFLILFFVSLTSVSAIGNDALLGAENQDVSENDAIPLAVDGEDVPTQNGQITVRPGDSIQSAIDNADAGSTIIVESGTYSEDLVVSKGLSIMGHDAVLNSEKTAFSILPEANYTSISGFDILVSDINGTGILINTSNCKITDNRISGGNIGIIANMSAPDPTTLEIRLLENITVLRNSISNMGEAGIFINAYNPTVSQNNVTGIINRKENGTALGIHANGLGLTEDLNVVVTDNRVSNIKSLNASAHGMEIGGNSIFDTLVVFDVFGNIVENVVAQVESCGVKIDVFSLSTTLPTIDVFDINITGISTTDFENSSATGIIVSATTIGQNETSDVVVHDVNIRDVSGLGANSKVIGIKATGVGCVDLYVEDNNLSDFKSFGSIEGITPSAIEYMKFMALVSVSQNNIANFNSPKTKGINAFSLGNVEITRNLLYNLPGEKSTFITALPLHINTTEFNITIPKNATIEEIMEIITNLFNNSNFTFEGNLSITGNNLEGTGVETAFASMREFTAAYNRAVNFRYNVVKDRARTVMLESYGYDPNLTDEELAYRYFKSQKEFENYTEEEIRNMSARLGAFMSQIYRDYDRLTAGDVDARYNWWGTNSRPDSSKFRNYNGTVFYEPWLVLSVSSNPHTIGYGEYSMIAADVYTDSDGTDHSGNAEMYFSGPRVTLSTDKGSFDGKKSITLDWINGQAVSYFCGDEYGLASISASDFDTAYATVLVSGKINETLKEAGIHSEATMHPSGNPVFLLMVAAILLSSFGIYRKK